MSKSVRIQAIDSGGNVVHEFPSIAAAGAAGFSSATINKQTRHGGKPVDGLLWRRANGPIMASMDRLEALATRLEAVARQLCKQK